MIWGKLIGWMVVGDLIRSFFIGSLLQEENSDSFWLWKRINLQESYFYFHSTGVALWQQKTICKDIYYHWRLRPVWVSQRESKHIQNSTLVFNGTLKYNHNNKKGNGT